MRNRATETSVFSYGETRQPPPGAIPSKQAMRRPAESAGRELEPSGNCRPRGMIAPRCKSRRQNPAYRLTLHLFRNDFDAVSQFSCFSEHGGS